MKANDGGQCNENCLTENGELPCEMDKTIKKGLLGSLTICGAHYA
jgi:hypothetical protein